MTTTRKEGLIEANFARQQQVIEDGVRSRIEEMLLGYQRPNQEMAVIVSPQLEESRLVAIVTDYRAAGWTAIAKDGKLLLW
jgi:hypothetical protein